MRRMDRYKEDDVKEQSRSDKNQDLYQNITTNSRYASFTDVTNANAYDISNTDANNNTRESYHRLKEYQNIEEPKEEKAPKEEVKEEQQEKRIYDINSFIEEARKNKKGQDELEGKRKLANTSYNILADLNKEELEKYRKEKQERINSYQESEIRELIDTIASKTLAGEIDKETSVDLLSDLMATSVMDRVEGVPEDEVTKQEEVVEEEKEPTDKLDYSKEILDKEVEEIKEEDNQKSKKEKKKKRKDKKNIETITGEVRTVHDADEDFYTRSMDLSDKDLDMSLEFNDSGMSIIVKLLLTILILGVIAVAGYFGYLYFFK